MYVTAMRRFGIQEALDDFRRLLAPDVPAFVIEHANDREWSQKQYLRHRKDTRYRWKCGVYLHFNAEEQLLYVGMATRGFDRFWGSRADDVRYTDIISIEEPYDVLIPALELFLIQRLRPPGNTRGVCGG